MTVRLHNKNIVIMVANGFDEVDFTEAQRALNETGATVKVVSTETGLANSWRDGGWGHHFPIDANVGTVLGSDYDALYIPGGERSLAKLADNAHAKRIVRSFVDALKPVALQGAASEMLAASERADYNAITGAGNEKNDEFLSDMLTAFAGLDMEMKTAA